MKRARIAPSYDATWLEVDRPQTLSDNKIESLIQEVMSGKLDADITDQVYVDFKKEVTNWLFASKLNTITGFDDFKRCDISNGCTQFIDSIYMQGCPQVLPGDYRYHQRLGNSEVTELKPGVPLIIAMPFPSIGDVHPQMESILNECLDKQIPVHIDGAWITCSRGIEYDISHPAIRSIGISLSKGLGLGWNRVALRWTKDDAPDAISIMNDFNMNNRALAIIGLHFVRNLPPDYLWNTHGDRYIKVCKDFDLTPTNSIHLAKSSSGAPVGIAPLIRYLENAN